MVAQLEKPHTAGEYTHHVGPRGGNAYRGTILSALKATEMLDARSNLLPAGMPLKRPRAVGQCLTLLLEIFVGRS